jgi:hypothetical protein
MDAKTKIKNYLDERAKNDELFAKAYTKSNKSIDECYKYVLGEARKKGTEVGMTAEEVYGLAVHYYDEDNIKINPVSGYVQASASDDDETKEVKLTAEEERQAREEAIHRLAEEQYRKMKKRPQRARKEENESVQQMSLF